MARRSPRCGRPVAIALSGMLALVVTSGVSLVRGFPLPAIHDEFSYLLAADTFARGRITNRPRPLWEHFESMHILVRPTYASKYPPAQGLVLACGQVLGGHPAWGVWLATGFAAAAICWMLMAFVPARWALLGGILVAVHPQVVAWGQSYWGGNVAMLGGALVLGGFARLTRPRMATRTAAVWYAVGLLVLANSRPYEGLILGSMLAVGVFAARWRGRLHPAISPPMRSLVLPMAAVLVPGAVLMLHYNWRVTGNPWRLPYQEHQTQYAVTPLFWFLPMRETLPEYRHKELERFHVREQGRWYSRRGAWQEISNFMHSRWSLHEGAVAAIGITVLMVPSLLRRNRRARLLTFVFVMFVLGLFAETFLFPHYAAPCVGVVVALGMMAMRRLARRIRPFGPWIVAAAVTLYFSASLLSWIEFARIHQSGFATDRYRITTELAAQPGRHLIVVRYSEHHNVHTEWVYNGADIDTAEIIWAREMDADRNRKLIDYFHERTVWLLEPAIASAQLRPYAP